MWKKWRIEADQEKLIRNSTASIWNTKVIKSILLLSQVDLKYKHWQLQPQIKPHKKKKKKKSKIDPANQL